MIDEQTKIDFLKNIGFDRIKHKEEDFNLLHHLIGTKNIILELQTKKLNCTFNIIQSHMKQMVFGLL